MIVAGTSKDSLRLDVARRLGADHIIVADEEDVVARVKEITGGAMCEVVVDATAGALRAAQTALAVAAFNGRVLVGGFREGRAVENFVLDTAVMNGLTIIGAFSHDARSVSAAIRLLESTKYDFQAMCTHSYGLGEVAEALETLGGEGAPDPIHITVRPDH